MSKAQQCQRQSGLISADRSVNPDAAKFAFDAVRQRDISQPKTAQRPDQYHAHGESHGDRPEASHRRAAGRRFGMLGLRNATPGARRWRQVWSDHRLLTLPPREVAKHARAALAAVSRTDEIALT